MKTLIRRADAGFCGSRVPSGHGVLRRELLIISLSPPERLCRNAVHGSTGSPRTEDGTSGINCLAVRPELVEGWAADYDTVSKAGEGSL